MRPTERALIDCSMWLSNCLKIGWAKGDLDFLESLWWKYHDHAGRITTTNTNRKDSDS